MQQKAGILHSLPVYRHGLHRILSRFDNITSIAFLESVHETDHFDLLFIDPQHTAATAIKTKAKIIYIVDQSEKGIIQKLGKTKPQAVLTMDCQEDEIADAIKHIMDDEPFYCTCIEDEIKIAMNNRCLPSKEDSLSAREMEVLLLIADNKKNKEIAEELFLSPHTIQPHRKKILKKLGASSALEAIQSAEKAGLL